MSTIVPLQYFDEYSTKELDRLISSAGRAKSLRDAAERVIRAIHGLPDVLEADQQKIEVYIGRAAATVTQLKNRWWTRFDAFGRAPSTHATVVTVTATERLRSQRWERAAQLIVERLVNNDALCCANALMGQSGGWPSSEDSLIYVVGKVRKGPTGNPVSNNQVNAAVAELVIEASRESFPADVVVAAGTRIQHRDDKLTHEIVYPARWDEPVAPDWPTCRAQDCARSARIGNYGFCGVHRAQVPAGQVECKSCTRAAIPGNFGFCGYHRAYTPPGLRPCKTCGRPAQPGNYGYCGRHR